MAGPKKVPDSDRLMEEMKKAQQAAAPPDAGRKTLPAHQPTKVMRHPRKEFRPPPRAAKGLDYPAVEVGRSTWLGVDGNPVVVLVDPSTGQDGAAAGAMILARIDAAMTWCDSIFGVRGLGGNAIVAAVGGETDGTGGAYHYGCGFGADGGDWYADVAPDPEMTLGLMVAEIVESYMGLQSRGWNCGGSGGEALSRVLAECQSGGANGALAEYASGPSYDGSNWIDADQGTDGDYPSIGCGVLYLYWLLSQGYTLAAIAQAGEPGGVLAGNYAALTGRPASEAWPAFSAAVQAIGTVTSDDPWSAAPGRSAALRSTPGAARTPAAPAQPAPVSVAAVDDAIASIERGLDVLRRLRASAARPLDAHQRD
jgi:hypothetical protein